MKLFYDLTVLNTHTASAPAVLEFKIDKGLITEAGVFFPPGCHGRVHTKIYFQAHQILPRNQENWCRGNNDWWRGEMYFPVTAEPLQIRVEAWADECNYHHTITIAIELQPWAYVPAWNKLIVLLTRMLQFMGAPIPKPTPTEAEP